MITELNPVFDGRKSFYGKATVAFDNDEMCLYSYNTLVAKIQDENAIVYGVESDTGSLKIHSATTLRHIKEFLRQNGFKAESKSQIEIDYMNC